MKYDLFEEQVLFNTVLIENLTDGEIGTGFLLLKRINESRCKQLLFSNKHVFWGQKDKNSLGITKKLRITLHKKQKDGSFNLGEVEKFKFDLNRGQDGYTDHPDSQVDVGCVNISDCFTKTQVNNRSLELEYFSDFDINEIVIGQRIIFVGYPTGFFDQKHFLPIARFGAIASSPSVDFNGKRQILIDAPVFPGSSGSPVFFQQRDGVYKLLGIISSTHIAEQMYVTVGNSKTSTKANTAVQIVGLGYLFKLDTIQEVCEMA